jgi:hypothetical protein
MIKIKITEIEVNCEEFIQELKDYCYNLKYYLKIHWLDKNLFNEHFKTNLTLLEFAIIMDDYGINIKIFPNNNDIKLYLVDIEKLLNSDL